MKAKSYSLRSLFLLLVLCPLLAHAVAPVNDRFITASIISGRNVTLKNQSAATATAEALDPYIGGVKLTKSVWYRMESPSFSDARITITHAAGGARFGVFTQADRDGGLGTLILQNEATNVSPGTDAFNFTMSSHNRYYLCVEATGLFDVTLQRPGAANDFFAAATVLSGNIGTTFADNTDCTNDGDFPAVNSATSVHAGIWYKWTPTFTGQAALNTNFSFVLGTSYHSTRIYVYTGTALSNLVQIAFNEGSGVNSNSRVAFAATSGTTYHIWVGSSGSQDGAIRLEYYQDNNPGSFEIYTPSSISESQGSAYRVEVRRHFAGSVAPSVTIASSNGSATAGSDYNSVGPTVLNFPAAGSGGDTAYVQYVSIGIFPDALAEGSENFILTLSSPTLGAQIPDPSATLTIANAPDPVAPGFTQPSYEVKETDGIIYIPLRRTNTDGQCYMNIQYGAAGNTAINGLDYNGSLVGTPVDAGESVLWLALSIANNGLSDGDRTFTIRAEPTLSTMETDGFSSVTVTIIDDEPRLPRAGRILTPVETSGFGATVDVKVAATGTLTGRLIMSRATYAFTGKLSPTGFFSVRLGPVGLQRTLTLQLLSTTSNEYTVTLADNELGQFVKTTAVASTFSAIQPCPQAGKYTMGNLPLGSLPQVLAGSIAVDKLGNATLTGKVFDGTAFVATGGVDPDGFMVAGVTLYAGQGKLTTNGALPVTVNAVSSSFGIRFIRPGRANQTAELPFISTSNSARVALYTPPVPGTRILNVWNPLGAGTAEFSGAGFVGTVTQNITVSTANAVTRAAPLTTVPSLKLTLTPATGIFTGTVIPPGSPVARPIFGSLFQLTSASFGAGFFLNPTVTPATDGQIMLH